MRDQEMAGRVASRFLREAGRGQSQIHKVMSTIQGAYRKAPRLVKTLEKAVSYKGDLAVGTRAATKLAELGAVVADAGNEALKLYAKILSSSAAQPHHLRHQASFIRDAVKEAREATDELLESASKQDRFMNVVGRNVMKAMEEVETAVSNTLLPALDIADEAIV